LVSPSSNETAFSTGVKLATNTSALALVAGNVSNAYVQCLTWANMFMSTTPADVEFAINQDFFPPTIVAQTITAWVAGIQGGILPQSALNDMLRSASITTLTDEEIKAESEIATLGGVELG